MTNNFLFQKRAPIMIFFDKHEFRTRVHFNTDIRDLLLLPGSVFISVFRPDWTEAPYPVLHFASSVD